MSCYWPEAVTFDDNVPRDGFCRIHLKVASLKVSGGFIRTAKATNANVEPKLEDKRIEVKLQLHSGGQQYVYVKDLVEPIIASKSEMKVKDGYVILNLCKSKDISWGAFYHELIKV